MISYDREFIFIHIPKCGGSSVEKALFKPDEFTWRNLYRRKPPKRYLFGLVRRHLTYPFLFGGLQHLKAWQVRDEVGDEIYDRFFKFAVVRNPYDRAVSQFEYTKRARNMRRFARIREDADFNSFLDAIVRRPHIHWEPQTDFICASDDSLIVDEFFCLSRIQTKLPEIAAKLGIQVDTIPHEKKSARDDYRQYYDEQSFQKVTDMYKRDLELLGYDFDGSGPN